ncbi:hypothetical protein ABLO03_20190, partial [Mycobacterium tuberculosis]
PTLRSLIEFGCLTFSVFLQAKGFAFIMKRLRVFRAPLHLRPVDFTIHRITGASLSPGHRLVVVDTSGVQTRQDKSGKWKSATTPTPLAYPLERI